MGGKSANSLEEIAAMLDRQSEAKDLQGLITNLEKVIYSGAGELLTEDAQFYAQMIGTRTTLKKTHQVQEEGIFFVTETTTGMKSMREVEEFIVHPNRIKRIEQGEALVIFWTVDTGYRLVAVPRARGFDQSNIQRMDVEVALKKRHNYLTQIRSGLTLGIQDEERREKGELYIYLRLIKKNP